jgi:hypothetical protein
MNSLVIGSASASLLALQDSAPLFGRGSGIDGFLIAMVAVSFGGFVILAGVVYAFTQRAARERARRLELLAEALRRPELDPALRQECLRALNPPERGTKWLFALGWLGIGGCISWFCTEPRGDEFTTAIIASVMSFAVLTLPLAWREATRARTTA